MNKKIIIGICVIVVIAVAISLIVMFTRNNIQNDENTPIGRDDSFYNDGNTAAEGMEPINKDIELGNVLQDVKDDSVNKLTGISDEEANVLIDLGEYVGLEKKVARYEDEDEFTEVWLFKISEQEQATKIFRKFNQRVEDLKYQFEGNPQITEILNNEKNIIMKQQQGIAVVIISDDAETVEKSVDIEFLK